MSKKKKAPETAALPVVEPPKPAQPEPLFTYRFSVEEQNTPYFRFLRQYYGNVSPQKIQQRLTPAENNQTETVQTQPRAPKRPVKVKRPLFLVLVALFALLYLAVAVFGFLHLESFGEANDYFATYQVILDFGDGDREVTTFGLDDIVWSSMAKFFGFAPDGEEEEVAEAADEQAEADEEVVPAKDYVFYDAYLSQLDDESKLAYKVACWAVFLAYALSVIAALYILIKAIVCLFSKKRHKFAFAGIFLFLLSLLAVLAMFGVVIAGEMAEDFNLISTLLAFLTMSVPEGQFVGVSVGIGTYLLLGTALLTWFFALFAYKSKKKAGDVPQKSKKGKKRR